LKHLARIREMLHKRGQRAVLSLEQGLTILFYYFFISESVGIN